MNLLTKMEQAFTDLEALLPGFKLKTYRGGVLYYNKSDEYEVNISFNYNNFRTRFTFSSITVMVTYFEIEDILAKYTIKHLGDDRRKVAFSSTISYGKFLSDFVRFNGVSNDDELNTLIQEVKSELVDYALVGISQINNLNKLAKSLEEISEQDRFERLGGEYAYFRKMIITNLTGEVSLYQEYKEEAIKFFQGRLEKDSRVPSFLDLLKELSEEIESII